MRRSSSAGENNNQRGENKMGCQWNSDVNIAIREKIEEFIEDCRVNDDDDEWQFRVSELRKYFEEV